MLIHKNSIYRQALTSQQKEQKKDYLLQQCLDRGTPSFKEIFESAKEYYDYSNKLNELEDDAIELLAEKHKEEYGIDGYTEFYNKYIKEIEQLAEELAIKEMEENYNALMHNSGLKGKPCYRAIALKEGVDPTKLDGLGTYWSREIHGADLYEAPGSFLHKYRATFLAEIDTSYLDVKTMIIHNLIYSQKEAEVTFFKHSPIYIHGVWITSRGGSHSTIGSSNSMLPIYDWRRC